MFTSYRNKSVGTKLTTLQKSGFIYSHELSPYSCSSARRKVICWSGYTAPLMFNVVADGEVLSFTIRPLYHRDKRPGDPLDRRPDRAQSQSVHFVRSSALLCIKGSYVGRTFQITESKTPTTDVCTHIATHMVNNGMSANLINNLSTSYYT
jgi:hypothetical protein